MSNEIDISVVIPAYIEEENLRIILPRLKIALEKLGVIFEIIVVDTAIPLDNTALVCTDFGAICIPREGGNLYGNAVRTGIAKVKGKWTIFMDADGSHTPEFIPSLYAQTNNYDVIIGSRYVEGGATENPGVLIFMSRVLNAIYTIVLRIPCKDVSNSFKLYRTELLKDLKLKCNHFDVVEEMLVRIQARSKRKIRYCEVPVLFKKRMFGETKRELVVFVFSFAITLCRLLWIKLKIN